jgi:hypothetical protein
MKYLVSFNLSRKNQSKFKFKQMYVKGIERILGKGEGCLFSS